MTETTYDFEVRKLCSNIAELCILKHRSYGTGNLLNSPFKPRTVIAVRLYEKVARMANLIETGHEPAEETYMDTLKDIIGYTVAAIQIEEKTFELPMEPAKGIYLGKVDHGYTPVFTRPTASGKRQVVKIAPDTTPRTWNITSGTGYIGTPDKLIRIDVDHGK